MSTSKHIDKVCIAAVCITLVLSILFMRGGTDGTAAAAKMMKYESRISYSSDRMTVIAVFVHGKVWIKKSIDACLLLFIIIHAFQNKCSKRP